MRRDSCSGISEYLITIRRKSLRSRIFRRFVRIRHNAKYVYHVISVFRSLVVRCRRSFLIDI